MPIQIYNNGAYINIVGENGNRRILKHDIVEVRVVPPQALKIDLGNPLKAVYISPTHVTVPGSTDAQTLSYLINDMITDCVCGRVLNPPS